MARFNALLSFVFALGFLISTSAAALAPASAPKASMAKSPAVIPPTPVSAPPKIAATRPESGSSPFSILSPFTEGPATAVLPSGSTMQTPAPSALSAAGPGSAAPPAVNSGAASTASLEKMGILAAALLGGAALFL